MGTGETVLWIASLAIFAFFVLYGLSTFLLILISLVEATLTRIERGELFSPPFRVQRPGVSLIAPAYNMEPLIVASARSLLASDYEPFEVVIVDDGSDDGTTAALRPAFDLIELPVGDRLPIATAPVERIYVSRTDPRLRVVRKQNGGRPDAINAGLNIARNELLAMVDADTLLEADALKRCVEVFAGDPDDVVAVGGNIRIANGSLIENHVVISPRVPHSDGEASQTGEYLRGFLCGRIAWSRLNGLLIISGAFGVFRRELLRMTGGRRRSAKTWSWSCASTISFGRAVRAPGSLTRRTRTPGRRSRTASRRSAGNESGGMSGCSTTSGSTAA